ncbi:hypothetical protein PMZ80_006319 [Knufia obscura]|uniref:histone acetyltransferase n=1 Tax=Knufia obscura TaxID=1635080 RepID=A0ABR0RKA8_9EURO|nr:hypothetical protein PMZ80_006319 [Knufia obscura]
MSSTPFLDNFSDFLANTLRVGTNLRVYHVSTPPTPTTPIFASLPGKQEEPTTCESHFLAVSQPYSTRLEDFSSDTAVTSNDENTKADNHVLVLGIEVLIFTTNTLTTIFVSKADSSGFLTRPPHSTQASSSIIRSVISAFLSWLVSRNLSSRTPETSNVTRHEPDPHPPNTENERISSVKEASVPDPNPKSRERRRRLVLSLFARSQNQYLFPGSIENATKHVLDDRQLIKWWCRVLDGLVEREWAVDVTPRAQSADANASANGAGTSAQAQHSPSGSTSVSASVKVTPQAYVIVPGCDRSETIRSFFPPAARYVRPGAVSRWHNSYPDQHLVDGEALSSGTDASVGIPVRCMIPRLPDDPKARYCEDLDHAGTDDQGRWRDIRSLQQFWETMEYRQECAAGRLVGFIWVIFDGGRVMAETTNGAATASDGRLSDVPNGHAQPDNPRTPPIKTLPDDATRSPPSTLAPASIVLSAEQYNTLADYLINHTDFAGLELARKSTRDWIDKVRELSGASLFGVDVEGQAAAVGTLSSSREDSGISLSQTGAGEKHGRDETEAEGPRVNVLTGVRKKRKVEGEGRNGDDVHDGTSGVGIVDDKQVEPDAIPGVNGDGARTLSAGLVRKKPKGSTS